MNISNHPVTSREYKLMLNVDRFKDRGQGAQIFFGLVEFLIKKAGGALVEKQNEEEKRRTSYLDTPELTLRQHGFALRLREETKDNEFQINLKYRDSDRYISAAQDLSSPQAVKTKFEEDILPPFVSKFSHSISIKTNAMPDLSSMQKVTALFPGLKKLNIGGNTAVKTINDFKAVEVVRKLCKFRFDEPSIDIKASLSFWYLTAEENAWPLVGEFSFDYDLADNETKGDKLEMYPRPVAERANRFFRALQNQTGWINFNTTTKTAFALEVL
jgi:hypothetical protein